jgi:nicotinamide-nucleotide amidase
MFSETQLALAGQVVAACKKNSFRLAVVESLTGGLVSAAITAIPGASSVFEIGYVTYNDHTKARYTGVPQAYIDFHTSVSHEAVAAMAEGVLFNAKVQVSVALSGFAGPEGGTERNPVGTVYIAAARPSNPSLVQRYSFKGDRHAVRVQSMEMALRLLIDKIHEETATEPLSIAGI